MSKSKSAHFLTHGFGLRGHPWSCFQCLCPFSTMRKDDPVECPRALWFSLEASKLIVSGVLWPAEKDFVYPKIIKKVSSKHFIFFPLCSLHLKQSWIYCIWHLTYSNSHVHASCTKNLPQSLWLKGLVPLPVLYSQDPWFWILRLTSPASCHAHTAFTWVLGNWSYCLQANALSPPPFLFVDMLVLGFVCLFILRQGRTV